MPVCIKKAQTHHLDLRFLPLDGIIIFAFLYFVKVEFSSSYFLCLSRDFPLYPLPPVNRQPVIQLSCNNASDFPNQRIFFISSQKLRSFISVSFASRGSSSLPVTVPHPNFALVFYRVMPLLVHHFGVHQLRKKKSTVKRARKTVQQSFYLLS